MSDQARALYLGAAGPLALVRCGWCGRRNCFDRRLWRWFEVMFCRRCWQGVLFEGLSMITRWEGERLLMENMAFGGELRAQREAERVARSLLAYYDSQPYWMWPPPLRRAASDLRKVYSVVEAARSRRGGNAEAPPEPAPAPARPAATAGRDELTADESRLLTYFAALPPDARAAMFTDLEALSRQAAGGGPLAEVRTSALRELAADGEGGGGRA